MNYLAEIIAFERWIETNYLPCSSQLIWYRLMNLSNQSGWSEWIVVDNQRLMAAVQLKKEETFIKARNELILSGLVVYERGTKGRPSKYKMISLAKKFPYQNGVNTGVENGVNSGVNIGVKSGVENGVKSGAIYKQNKIKQNISPKPPTWDQTKKSTLDQYNSFMKSDCFDFEDLEKRLIGN